MAFCVYRLGILEFLSLVSSPDLIGGSHHRDPRVKPEDDIVGNSRIPYRDPPKGLGDDIVRNSRIPSIVSRCVR